tara:strand:- start:319 stop:597 length:279 start_codon:yes stop_codon:yes gene_type:complete
MSKTYTDKVQTREVANDKGVTKTFKSTGVDKKGKHFFTSSDGAKIKEYKTGKKPNIKTGMPVVGTLMNRRAKNLTKGDITKKLKMGGVTKKK